MLDFDIVTRLRSLSSPRKYPSSGGSMKLLLLDMDPSKPYCVRPHAYRLFGITVALLLVRQTSSISNPL